MIGITVRKAVAAVGLACGLAALGCSGSDGVNRHRVSGSVTFDGKPIPAGLVIFSPDLSKKNDGPEGVAEIRNGRYDTTVEGGKGVAGGPTVVKVAGTTADGKALCLYEFTADLPRESSTRDIEVPKTAASKGREFEGP